MLETYTVYNIILIFGVLVSAALSIKNDWKRTTNIVIFAILFIPAALRFGVGLDYFNYVDIFNHIDNYQGRIEIGFYAIVKILTVLGFGYQSLFVVCSALTIYFYIKSIRHDSAWTSTLVFVSTLYLTSYCLLRQALAVSIIMYCTKLWVDNKRNKTWFFILIACTMHYSVILFVPVLMASSLIKMSTSKAIAVMCFIVVFVFLLNGVDLVFNNQFFINSRYGTYITSSYNKETEIGSGMGILIRLLVPISVSLLASKILALNPRNNIIICSSLAFFISYLLATQIYIFGRMSDVFSFSVILAAPLLIQLSRTVYTKLIASGVILLYILVMQATIANNHFDVNERAGSGLGIYPYKTVFDK
ncbi:EpsG family protein [Scandinavium manionii]|uniref:EpsG family protein n=1 Tax=Scandinavium manionii TaxID=2926520 RepID=UPI0021658A1C|nr:EpsG family protein [Scandinavium manionii]MCS2168272.1 EpsG family protein [Scandinavium manionii]